MSWTAILVLAAGAYICKAIGLLVVGPLTNRRTGRPVGAAAGGEQTAADEAGLLVRAGQLLPPALLAALVVSQTVVTGTELTVDARLAGVVAGGTAAVWKQAPFWLVLVIAATVTALIRQLS
ncbi:MAG: AzlD domain-containing protein [Actinomycetota bacterium]